MIDLATGTGATHRGVVVELWKLWKTSGRTFDLGAILASPEKLLEDDGVNGRFNDLVGQELPSRIGAVGVVTWSDESARALLRDLPDHIVQIKRESDIDHPYDPDQVQSYDNYYRDFTKIVLRQALLQMLFATENPPRLLSLAFNRTYDDSWSTSRCWYELIREFVSIAEEDLGIFYKYE